MLSLTLLACIECCHELHVHRNATFLKPLIVTYYPYSRTSLWLPIRNRREGYARDKAIVQTGLSCLDCGKDEADMWSCGPVSRCLKPTRR